MIDATIEMLRLRHVEHAAYVGVVGALFCDDLPAAIVRLENARDAAREYAGTLHGSRDRAAIKLARLVAGCADDLIPGVQQLATLASTRTTEGTS